MLADQVRSRAPIVVHQNAGVTSFVHADQAAAAIVEIMRGDVTGPVNLAAQEPMDTVQLAAAIGAHAGMVPEFDRRPAPGESEHGSPFSYDRDFALDTTRLGSVATTLEPASAWLPDTVRAFFG